MLYLAIFILLLLLLIVFISAFLKLNILIEYLRNGWDDHIVISIYTLGGLLKYKYELPLVNINEKGIKFKKVKKKGKKENIQEEEKKKFGFGELFDRIEYMMDIYKTHIESINGIKRYLKCKIVLRELDFKIVVGTGDACMTGILNGIIWAVVGIAYSYFSRSIKFSKPHVNIESDFNSKRLNVNLYCIFSIKFVHIIVVGFILISKYLKRRWFHWQNIQYKVL